MTWDAGVESMSSCSENKVQYLILSPLVDPTKTNAK